MCERELNPERVRERDEDKDRQTDRETDKERDRDLTINTLCLERLVSKHR